MFRSPQPLNADWRRWLVAPLAGALAVLILFALLRLAMTPRPHEGTGDTPSLDGISIVQMKPDATPEPPQTVPEKAPPPPPDAPPALARPELASPSMPALSAVEINAGPVVVAVNPDTNGLGAGSGIAGLSGLGSGLGSGSFGGFAGGGGGGKGFGTGKGFSGKALVPISTARPQMPEWACKQRIKGWVEVVFTVMPNGHVQDVKIVDADPRGVYEAAAIESVGHWIYPPYDKAREVKQRVPMDPDDCAFNYPN
jgi:periplasmic protein TonB